MDNFVFSNKTEIIFGRDTELQTGKKIIEHSGGTSKNVLIVYGSERVKTSGLYERVVESITTEGIEVVDLGGVLPNPRLGLVYEGIKLSKRENVDYIVALGGGSVIDTAKAIGVGIPYDGDVWDFFLNIKAPKQTVPVATISTIPAAGSESSLSSVITNEDGWYKKSINLELIRPVFSIVNAELTYSLPPYQIGAGVVDMMTHVLERYFTNTSDVDFTDRLCEATLRTIINNGKQTLEYPNEYKYRAEIVWAGIIAHNGLLNTGRVQDWASHRIALELGGIYDITHGATLAIIMPNWMKYVYKHDLDRFVQYAVRVWDVDFAYADKEEIALEGIRRTQSFFAAMGMPLSLSEAGVNDNRFDEMADKATFGDTIPVGNFVKIDKKKMIEIYNLSK